MTSPGVQLAQGALDPPLLALSSHPARSSIQDADDVTRLEKTQSAMCRLALVSCDVSAEPGEGETQEVDGHIAVTDPVNEHPPVVGEDRV